MAQTKGDLVVRRADGTAINVDAADATRAARQALAASEERARLRDDPTAQRSHPSRAKAPRSEPQKTPDEGKVARLIPSTQRLQRPKSATTQRSKPNPINRLPKKVGKKPVTFRLKRSGDVDLVFDGVCLVDMSSEQPGKDFWTEIRIYRTDSGRYVAESVGRAAGGEKDRRNVSVVHDPVHLREALMRRKRAPGEVSAKPVYLTRLAVAALEQAAKADPRVGVALVERI